jgi:hypothetical protein
LYTCGRKGKTMTEVVAACMCHLYIIYDNNNSFKLIVYLWQERKNNDRRRVQVVDVHTKDYTQGKKEQ